ncbi:uncharacterized protein JN550_013194 [Neoarthrinium moseri]|uniref:uncharacterized protein n=1 Tax=Neoarthrinium moseri TaxID=1658444 RepID=UPI001FDE5B57|nr:uncharacterized protein JN550_013194 [Neoarthrinium moseri]KAI1857561.1 hypothetical protein JN550_013194 [Neoarthrinium moseri]
MARQISVDHSAMDLLVETIAELTKLPSIQVTTFNQEKQLWSELPVLEMELLERFTGLSSTRPTETLQYTLEQEPCMDWDLQAASEYIIRAGENIFQRLDDPKFSELAFEGGPLYTGPKGVNKERWDFWKKRFRECGEALDTESGVRQRASEAADKMEKIEQQVEH